MKRGGWLVLAVLLPRLLAFFVNENLAGDAIARTWLAHRWLSSPHLMTSFDDGARQFGPLHLYLLAFAEWVWPSLLHAGRVVSLVAGALTAWPLYLLTTRRFGARAATFAVLGFAFWGLHVQCSTTSASEALNLLLVMSAVALFDAERKWAAALLLNLACATRYDSWLLVPLLALTEAWRSKRVLEAAAFGAGASIFAVTWLIGNQVGQGDALFPIRFIDQFHRDWWPSEAGNWGEAAYRLICLLFWPGAAALTLFPLVAGPGLLALRKAWRDQPEVRWLVALIVVPAVLYTFRSAVMASFAPLARFTMKELLLLLPFAGAALAAQRPRLAWTAIGLAAAWCLGLGLYCYEPDSRWSFSLRSIAATSRLEPQLRVTTSWLQQHPEGLLVVDEDPRGFDDLPISYFSGRPFDEQLRRRYERYAETLGSSTPRWLVLFEGGKLEREATLVEEGHLDYRGHRFELRRAARAKIYERVD